MTTPEFIDDELDSDALTKTTVYLTKKSVDAMHSASAATDDSLTDTLNRALVVYAELVNLPVGGAVSWDHQDGVRRKVRIVE